jgi:hypothetical protein
VRLLAAVEGAKMRVALTTIYAAGLRVSEVVALRAADIDSEKIALCRRLLAVPPPAPADDAAECGADRPSQPTPPCPCCGGRMRIVETFEAMWVSIGTQS